MYYPGNTMTIYTYNIHYTINSSKIELNMTVDQNIIKKNFSHLARVATISKTNL